MSLSTLHTGTNSLQINHAVAKYSPSVGDYIRPVQRAHISFTVRQFGALPPHQRAGAHFGAAAEQQGVGVNDKGRTWIAFTGICTLYRGR